MPDKKISPICFKVIRKKICTGEIAWVIGDQLGNKSRHGDVYQAKCDKKATFIFKIQSDRKKFEREVVFHKQVMTQPNIIPKLVDSFACGTGGVMIIEKMSMTLDDALVFIRKSKNIVDKMKAKNSIYKEICSVIKRLHSTGVIHGDPHGGNFMCNRNIDWVTGDKLESMFKEWKVIDVGNSKSVDEYKDLIHTANALDSDYETVRDSLL
jgi:serine/threonine protein kinase